MLSKVIIQAGIDKQTTTYGAEGRWIDSKNVRFRTGLPEKVGGWSKLVATRVIGVVRAMKTWYSTGGIRHLAIGTDRKLYVYAEGAVYDITPVRLSATLNGCFTSTGNTTVTVVHTSHGALVGDFVTYSGAATVGGQDLNNEYQITTVIDANNYTITHSTNVSAASGAGGASVATSYQINVGSATSSYSYGWGTGAWNVSTWNTARTSSSIFLEATYWVFDTYGEDLIAMRNNGSIYKWDLSAGVNTAAAVVANAPTANRFVLISADQHMLALGTELTIATPASQDNMMVRWSNMDEITNWAFSSLQETSAGYDKVQDGSKIVAATRSRGGILVWTDTALNTLTSIGGQYVFSLQQVGSSCGAISPFCFAEVNGVTFWMSQTAFYMFDGSVKKLECSVQDFVFGDISPSAQVQTFCGLNVDFNEVTWFYPSEGEEYVDKSVTYNYLEKVWYTNTGFTRSAWTDRGVFANPYGADYSTVLFGDNETVLGLTAGSSYLYVHEDGTNDDGGAMDSYITSGDIDIEDGDQVYHVSRVIPDFKVLTGNQMQVTTTFANYPASTNTRTFSSTISAASKYFSVRGRGRQANIKIASNALDADWRFGTVRYDIKPDGMR
jgi:hypothetical protein